MDIIITEWALQSYVDLKKQAAFTDAEYWGTIRPDVERLKGGYPSQDTKFLQANFWGPVKDPKGHVVPDGYKMKWRQIGSGKIQLRVIVVIMNGAAYLCQAYNKTSDHLDRREMAKTKYKMNLISVNKHQERGKI